MYCCVVTAVRHIALLFLSRSMCYGIHVHPDLKTFCVLYPHEEIALEASIILSGRVASNSRSSCLWQVSELERVISLMNARPLDYCSRLIVDSEGLSAMCHLKLDSFFSQRVL